MSKFDPNRSFRITFNKEEFFDLIRVAKEYDMSVPELCTRTVQQFIKFRDSVKEKKEDE